MRAEPIDLPQSADQLQFLCLQMREELIELKSARQHEQNEMRDEIALLKYVNKDFVFFLGLLFK